MGRNGIVQAYATGAGLVRVRARHTIEDKGTRQQIVVTEIPYQVRKLAIIEKIVEVVKEQRITGISDVRDESDREGLRLVIELKKGEDPQVVLNQLFQYTPLQTSFSIINLAIDNRQPRTLDLRGMLESYISHRKNVIRRRSLFLKARAEERQHIVEGLRSRSRTSTRSCGSSARARTATKRRRSSPRPSASPRARRRRSSTCASAA
jgi:DNA gyrase subunit A